MRADNAHPLKPNIIDFYLVAIFSSNSAINSVILRSKSAFSANNAATSFDIILTPKLLFYIAIYKRSELLHFY